LPGSRELRRRQLTSFRSLSQGLQNVVAIHGIRASRRKITGLWNRDTRATAG
jgi:hypothetical protein